MADVDAGWESDDGSSAFGDDDPQEGAVAAVAVKLTEQDVYTAVRAFIIAKGGMCRFGHVGGKFGVTVDWLEEHFIIDRRAGVVFSSEEVRKRWIGTRRVKSAKKTYEEFAKDEYKFDKKKSRKDRDWMIREKYVPYSKWGTPEGRIPIFRDIKKGKVKPIQQ